MTELGTSIDIQIDLYPSAVDGEDAYKKLEQVGKGSMLLPLKPAGSDRFFRINLAESVSSSEQYYFHMTW